MNAELNALKDALDGQREHVLGILDGLSEQDLRGHHLARRKPIRGLARQSSGSIPGDFPQNAQVRLANACAHPMHRTIKERETAPPSTFNL